MDERIVLRIQGTQAAEALIRLNDGDAALLYLYLTMRPNSTVTKAAGALGWNSVRVGRARGLLLAYGLCADNALPPPRAEASIDPADLLEARQNDPAFAGMCSYLESCLGRVLRKPEMETLLSTYTTLNMTPDVMILLISFCKEENQLSARGIERWAYSWHDRGLTTYEAASHFLDDWRLRNDRHRRIMGIFGSDRRPSDAERAYMDDWITRGITPQLISAAYDQMTQAIGRFNWAYINKILCRWNDEGIRTPVQARERRTENVAEVPKNESAESVILRRMAETREARARTLIERQEEMRTLSPAYAETEKELRLCASRIALSQGDERKKAQEQQQMLLTRRAGLLRACGKPEDWLDLRPACALCGDHGYIGTRRCECLLRALNKENGGTGGGIRIEQKVETDGTSGGKTAEKIAEKIAEKPPVEKPAEKPPVEKPAPAMKRDELLFNRR